MKNKNEPSSLSYLGYLTKIKEKEYEIEYLKKQVDLTINNYNSLVDKFNQSQSENKRLKAEIEDLKDEIIYLKRKIAIRDNALKDRDRAIEMLEGKQDTIVNQAKIDVLNELKGRVRTSYVLDDFILGNVVFSKDIDELIEEVENEKKD